MSDAEDISDAEAELELARARSTSRAAPTPATPQQSEPGWFDPGSTSKQVLDAATPNFEPEGKAGTFVRHFGQGSAPIPGVGGIPDELGGAFAAGKSLLDVSLPEAAGQTAPGRAVLRIIHPSLRTATDAEVDEWTKNWATHARKDFTGGTPASGAGDVYRQQRDFLRGEVHDSARLNPGLAALSSTAGALASPSPFGKMKAVTTAQKAMKLAAQGGATGVGTGFGRSEAQSPLGVAGDMLFGGIVGGVAAPVIGTALDKGGAWAGRKLSQLSDEYALKHFLGITPTITNKMQGLGYRNMDEVRELGRAARDMGLVKVGDKAEDALRRVQAEFPLRTQMAENVIRDIDDVASGLGITADDVFGRAAARTEKNIRGQTGLTATADEAAGPALDFVKQLNTEGQRQAAAGNTTSLVHRLNEQKRDIQRAVSYKVGSGRTDLADQLERAAAAGPRETIEELAAELLDPQRASELVTANKRIGQLVDLQSLAADEATRQAGRADPLRLATILGVLSGAGSGAAMGASQNGLLGGIMGGGGGAALLGIGGLVARQAAPYLPAVNSAVSSVGSRFARWAAPKAANAAAKLMPTTPTFRAPREPEERERESVRVFQSDGL